MLFDNRGAISLTSGRFAIIANEQQFTLVPWRPNPGALPRPRDCRPRPRHRRLMAARLAAESRLVALNLAHPAAPLRAPAPAKGLSSVNVTRFPDGPRWSADGRGCHFRKFTPRWATCHSADLMARLAIADVARPQRGLNAAGASLPTAAVPQLLKTPASSKCCLLVPTAGPCSAAHGLESYRPMIKYFSRKS